MSELTTLGIIHCWIKASTRLVPINTSRALLAKNLKILILDFSTKSYINDSHKTLSKKVQLDSGGGVGVEFSPSERRSWVQITVSHNSLFSGGCKLEVGLSFFITHVLFNLLHNRHVFLPLLNQFLVILVQIVRS